MNLQIKKFGMLLFQEPVEMMQFLLLESLELNRKFNKSSLKLEKIWQYLT